MCFKIYFFIKNGNKKGKNDNNKKHSNSIFAWNHSK